MDKLRAILESTGLEVAYYQFKNPPPLPYIIYLFIDSDNFVADNKVHYKLNNYLVELYSDVKDPASELLIEEALDNAEIVYDKSEDYIESENMYQVVYEIQI